MPIVSYFYDFMISTICVCGAGTMGSGIAQVAAMAGYRTVLFELNPGVLDRARINLQKTLDNLLAKSKITEQIHTAVGENISFTSNINDCKAHLIIEAIIEKPEAKISLFNQLAGINDDATLFASNTSSLSITELASQIQLPERVIGLHFFNPAPLMKLVEVVETNYNQPDSVNTVIQFVKQLGKQPVLCKDTPGFIVNRVARPYYIASLRLAETGLYDFETIDRLLENCGFKLGPFKLMDLIGNDINYAVSCSVYEQLNKPERLRPSNMQKEKVENGDLGKKSGKGYYNYS